jgi:murein DD-endopeptidase MepM/ murein hydrolase activator NlpD
VSHHVPAPIRVARLVCAALVLATAAAACQPTPSPPPIRSIVFPVAADVSYSDTFGAARSGGRSHEGQDLMARKGTIAVAAVDGTVSWLRHDTSGLSGNMLRITDAEGWQYVYIHLNNDHPGTDDGANRYDQAFVDGIRAGQKVKAGEPVGFVGDSGNAESTGAHLHFEIRTPDGIAVDAYSSLRASGRLVLGGAQLDATRPYGTIDQLQAGAGAILARGWAIDRATDDPTDVTMLVDGNPRATFRADGSRPDLAAAFPGVGEHHGFDSTVAGVAAGAHEVCLVAHNAGLGGGSTRLGCAFLTVG